jgi:hypothetical protein
MSGGLPAYYSAPATGFSAYQSAPVTQQAVVTVNAGFDRFFCNARKDMKDTNLDDRYKKTDDHCFTIQQRELVFRLNPKHNRLITRPDSFNGVNDIALKVFSSCNSFPDARLFKTSLQKTPLSTFSKDAVLRNAISFVGVALQPVDYMNTNQKDNVAVQVAGSCTIWNTGTHVIRPGQKIVWNFPGAPGSGSKRKQPTGEPINKMLLSVAPLESELADNKSMSYDFVSALFAIHDPMPATGAPATDEAISLAASITMPGDTAAEMKDKYIEFSKKLLVLYEELRSRVIGIALSGAAPGDQFDIMLCSSH